MPYAAVPGCLPNRKLLQSDDTEAIWGVAVHLAVHGPLDWWSGIRPSRDCRGSCSQIAISWSLRAPRVSPAGPPEAIMALRRLDIHARPTMQAEPLDGLEGQ